MIRGWRRRRRFFPIPFTWRSSSGDAKGPCSRRKATIRLASPGPIPGRIWRSRAEARLRSMRSPSVLRAAPVGGGIAAMGAGRSRGVRGKRARSGSSPCRSHPPAIITATRRPALIWRLAQATFGRRVPGVMRSPRKRKRERVLGNHLPPTAGTKRSRRGRPGGGRPPLKRSLRAKRCPFPRWGAIPPRQSPRSRPPSARTPG